MNATFVRPAACLVAAGLALSLAACSVLPKSEPSATYKLPDYRTGQRAAAQEQRAPAAAALRIHAPESGRALNSDRIIIAEPDGRLTAWQGLRWSDPAPILLRDRLAEAFLHDGRTSVSLGNDHAAADMDLLGTLRAFQFEKRGDAYVVAVQLDARLVDRASLRTLATRRFALVREAAGKGEGEAVTAFGAAADALADQVVAWVMGAGGPTVSQSEDPRRPGTEASSSSTGER